MSASTAIGMIGESLKELLEEEMAVTPGIPVTLLAPDETGANRRINMFLYRVEENSYLKNKDWEVSTSDPSRIRPPPLSLNLHYLLTPHAINDDQTGNTSAHEILGDAMRVLHQFSIIPTEHLAAGLLDAREQIKIMQVPVDIDEISKIWSTFNTAYRLSVAYEVAVVQLDLADAAAEEMPARISSVGVPNVSSPMAVPTVTSISPIAGPIATTISIRGKNLSGWRAYVEVGGQRVADGVEIEMDSFEVEVPAGLPAGFHRVRIDISKLHRSTFYFEITT